ncbi:MAG: alpha/beta hydrolase [Bacteroidia bacterium]|jgi:pimeloyl-ACP methyl ester carboxylesterase|nr:alpha/beta hydrolase [Bacteroidia bacterium]
MLHFAKQGVGPAIVLIHGFCENSTCFNEQVFLLKDHFTLVTIDLPGHGKSPEPIQGTLIQTFASQVKAVLDAEAIQTAIIIGHSMGGYVTLALAQQYPEIVKGIGLMHSTATSDTDERKAKREQAIAAIDQKGAAWYINQFIPPLFASATSPLLVESRQSENNKITAQSLQVCLNAMRLRNDSIGWLKQTQLPIGFWVGKYDTIIPENTMLEQAAMPSVSHLTYLSESGHMGMLEQPKECSEGIRKFANYCLGL